MKDNGEKLRGAICNVPVECDQTCNQLPHPPGRSCIIILKLKRKLQSRGHVYFCSTMLRINSKNYIWDENWRGAIDRA